MNENILQKLIELANEFHVKKLILFGSSLDSIETSIDIDFACDGLYDRNFFRFGAKLEKLFNKPVDLIPLEPANEFTQYISQHGRIIYESAAN
jgi:predicted nucleotidyltransferase